MGINRDFCELFKTFNDEGVRFLIVGAHAVAYHAEPRYTKDLDIWVEPSLDNAARVWKALKHFGAPLRGVTQENFKDPSLVYQIGIEPNRIDLAMGIDGVTFPTAWRNRVRTSYGSEPIYVLGKSDLLRAKRATGRSQDLLDIERLRVPGKTKKKRRPTR